MVLVKENTIYKLSKRFALRIIHLYVFLRDSQHENVMSRQISAAEQVSVQM